MLLDFTDHSAPYITGNGFAVRCGRYFAWGNLGINPTRDLGINPTRDNDVIYCKTDDVGALFVAPPWDPFVLVTHNSDLAIGEECRRYLDDSRVKFWLAQNPAIDHPKLRALPIGIANREWPHGDVRAIQRHVPLGGPYFAERKREVVFASYFSENDTDGERARCAQILSRERVLTTLPKTPFPDYLDDLSRAWFCASPRGRGIDAHRTWEALLVGTIPIVTRSLVARDHEDFPIAVLDRWDDFCAADFTPERARRMWDGFDRSLLFMDGYLKRLETRYGVSF